MRRTKAAQLPQARTIDDYLAAVPDAGQRAALEKLRKTIRSAAPGAEECFSYGLPAYRLDGTVIAGFGASKGHCAFYPMSGSIVAAHAGDLAKWKTTKGSIHFQPDAPLPASLVRKLVKARIAESA